MATITLRGNPVTTVGELPQAGEAAPALTLTGTDLSDFSTADLAGKRVVLNIFPSVDTGICAESVRKFNELATTLPDTVVVCASKDLPFAQARFCGAEGIENVRVGSAFRSDFGDALGLTMADGPMAGLLARSVVVLDADGSVIHTELVPEIGQEPDYDSAVAALS
ncbi:thiol peroxidase [Ornithinimicrobium humiphilum]|uniref:Thiol peroxidase n=1 Tax=Ornithinimicrobium humiphilum TaxID=125288 RepID=A0A543KNY2_9MICO|nr:thiol peroxidase [Ornithinimicrobium humiphilum]TQM96787.1 thiol peroxidase (atypical 2-Cys peroxiredoxin) [Ornithinimicrobium humiphilum]